MSAEAQTPAARTMHPPFTCAISSPFSETLEYEEEIRLRFRHYLGMKQPAPCLARREVPGGTQLFTVEDLQTPSLHDVAPLQAESGGPQGAEVPDISDPQRSGWGHQNAGTTFTS